MLNTTSTAVTAPYPAAHPASDLLVDLLADLAGEGDGVDPRTTAVTRPMPAARAEGDGAIDVDLSDIGGEQAEPLPPAPRAGRGTTPPPVSAVQAPIAAPGPARVTSPALPATLEPVRFGEFLLERELITEQQWLAALAAHWSDRQATVGATLVAQGVLPRETIEAEAALFHDELDVVEIVDRLPRIQRDTERM